VSKVDFVSKAYRDDVVIEGSMRREKCAALYYRPWDHVPPDEQGNL
jgi:tRNA(adenine34) deaminase